MLVNVLVAEFAKRSTKLTYRAVDEYSYNEMLEQKRARWLKKLLMSQAQVKIFAALIRARIRS